MAKVIIKVATVYASSNVTDKQLEKLLTKAIADKRKQMESTKTGGVYKSCNIHHLNAGRNRYKIILSFLSFS